MALPSSQINEINKLLLAYSAGKYHKKGRISTQRNEFDTIISALNMLGEELFATTVSRNYFSSIYDSVADMLFVLSPGGMVQDINKAAVNILKYKAGFLHGKNISFINSRQASNIFTTIKKQLKEKPSCSIETFFTTSGKTLVPVACTCSKIFDRNDIFKGYLLIAEDISGRKASEQKFLRAIIDTQEKERLRISKDMHDSMGLHLAAQKMYIGSLQTQLQPLEGNLKKAIQSLNELNTTAIANMRSACFDLMPSALEKNGIDMALRELLQKLKLQNVLNFHYQYNIDFPLQGKSLEITIYRIIQEFINNTIKHAMACNVYINISFYQENIRLHIVDDGIGFDLNDSSKNRLENNSPEASIGHGLNNIATRVNALNGILNISSKINKGTQLEVLFPI